MLLHFHSHHSFSCKEGIICSQALRYNMIIFEDHNLLKELNNLIRILLARAYPLHLITKNMIKALTYVHCNLQSQRTSHAETNLLHIITPFLDIGKSFTATIHKNWHTIAKVAALCASGHLKLSVYSKSSSINMLSTPHKHMAHHNTISNTAHSYSNTPIHTQTHRQTHSQ